MFETLSGRIDRIDANKLFVDELLDTNATEFASLAGLLHPAEGRFGISPIEVVNEHHAYIHATG